MLGDLYSRKYSRPLNSIEVEQCWQKDIYPLGKLKHAFLILSLSTLVRTSNQTSNIFTYGILETWTIKYYPLFCFWNARMFPLKQDLTHPCLANKRGLNDTTFTICCGFARTWVSDSNFIWIKLPEWDKDFQNISSIYLNCYNKLQPNLWRRLYHLPQLTDFASLVPP